MVAAAARASALRANSGFDVYERVAPLGRVIVRMHRFSARIILLKKKKGVRRKGARRDMRKPLAFFSLFFDDLVIEGINTPECLRADLVENEYRGRRRRGFTVLCALI
jgi:hypothetical protein